MIWLPVATDANDNEGDDNTVDDNDEVNVLIIPMS